MACESFVEPLVGSLYFLQQKVVPKIFPNLNVVGYLAVPAGWGSCLPRLAIFFCFWYHEGSVSRLPEPLSPQCHGLDVCH